MNTSATTLQQMRPLLPVRLFNAFGALLEKTQIASTRLSASGLIETAKRRCGLNDFGDGDFFEALSRLLESCHDEARLNLIGRIALKVDVLETLGARLQMERDRQLYPNIARQEISEPLFILGLPRSGTSVLHRLLAADPQHRSPLMWEVRSPSPPTLVDENRRIRRAMQSCRFFNWLVPAFRYVHAVGAEVPQECVGLMTPTFLSDQLDAMASVSSLVTILRSAFSDTVDPFTIYREAIQYWSETLDKFLNERDRLASDRICDVDYDQICRDPIAAVSQVYDHFGWSLSAEAEQRMRALVGSQVRGQSGNHRYHLSQFGSSAEEVLGAFAPYCQRFGFCPVDDEKRWGSRRDPVLLETKKRSVFASVTGKNNLVGHGNFANDLRSSPGD